MPIFLGGGGDWMPIKKFVFNVIQSKILFYIIY